MHLFALLDALLALIVALNVVQLAPGELVASNNTADGTLAAQGSRSAVSCEDGVATYWRAHNESLLTDIEELAHAWHCENGDLYAAPPPFPLFDIPERPDTYVEAYRMGVPFYYWSGAVFRPGMTIESEGPLAEAEWFSFWVRKHAEGLR